MLFNCCLHSHLYRTDKAVHTVTTLQKEKRYSLALLTLNVCPSSSTPSLLLMQVRWVLLIPSAQETASAVLPEEQRIINNPKELCSFCSIYLLVMGQCVPTLYITFQTADSLLPPHHPPSLIMSLAIFPLVL